MRLLRAFRVRHRCNPAHDRQHRVRWITFLLSAFQPEAPHTALTWGVGANGLLTNVAITTPGNLIGWTLFVAVPFQLVTTLQEKGRWCRRCRSVT